MTSIFQLEENPEVTSDGAASAKPDTRDKLTKAASQFHKAPDGGEPDWAGMLLNAKDQTEKFKIRAARDAYNEEKRFQHFQQQQAAHQAHIAEILRTPHRNKTFYDNLKVSDPQVFWSTECQRQMKTDKATMCLSFHLKGK
jgi:hypothetical protein